MKSRILSLIIDPGLCGESTNQAAQFKVQSEFQNFADFYAVDLLSPSIRAWYFLWGPDQYYGCSWPCSLCHLVINTLRPWQDGRHFCRRHSHMHFLEWKHSNFKWNFIEIRYLGSSWQLTITGSGNGLSPNSRQAIIWTNDGIVYWHICVTRPQCDNSHKNIERHTAHTIVSWPNPIMMILLMWNGDVVDREFQEPFTFHWSTYSRWVDNVDHAGSRRPLALTFQHCRMMWNIRVKQLMIR